MDFKQLYAKASENQKLEFLNGIISNNADLQQAFLNFTGNTETAITGLNDEQFSDIVSETETEYMENFEMVDLENPDWDNYTPSHSGYIEEWQQYQEAGEQEFERIFEIFYNAALDNIIRQKVDELVAMLVGLYLAAQNAEVNDEYDSFGDVNEFLLTEHKTVLDRIIEKLKLSAVTESTPLSAMAFFLNYCGKEVDGCKKFVTYFEDFLITLAEKSTKPDQILSIIRQSGIEPKALPRLILMLNQHSGGKDEWLATAKQYYRENKEIAAQLLQHYLENDMTAYLQLARELFNNNKGFWASILKKHITPENDLPLFVDVYCRLVADKNSMNDYQQLRPHLTPERLEQLLSDLDNHYWGVPFKARVLAAENRHEEIKKKIERKTAMWFKPEILALITKAYPEFCFNLIKDEVQNIIKHQRGRDAYQTIVTWLKLADAIPGHQPQSQLLISELYNHKPNLPALKDEMRKGGVV
jgi:hypothetical protein